MKSKSLLDQLVVFSDHHAHNFKFNAKEVPYSSLDGFYNSRLVYSANVLREISTYCKDFGVNNVLFGGDLFHVRSVIPVDVWNVVNTELDLFPNLFMVPGNHDYRDRKGKVHSLQTLKGNNITVCDNVREVRVTPLVSVFPVPYTDDPEEARSRLRTAGALARASFARVKILLAHLGMQGATVGSDYVLVSQSDVETSDVPYDDFTLCLFGHYHQRQKLFRNGWFIGATHHHNWGDSNSQRGFLHIKFFDDGSFEQTFIETQASPKFLKLDENSTTRVREQDFVRYYLAQEESEDRIIDSIKSSNLEVVDFVEESGDDIELDSDYLDPVAAVSSWVDKFGGGKDSLKKLGKSLLSMANQEDL